MAAVFVEYRMFLLGDLDARMPEDIPTLFGPNGLAAASPGIVVVHTGIHTGHVQVEIDTRTAPPPLQTTTWDDVVEVSVDYPHGRARLQTWGGDIVDGPPPLASVPGLYRLRVHARGRTLQGGAEEYLVQSWPTTETEPSEPKLTDDVGAANRALVRDHIS